MGGVRFFEGLSDGFVGNRVDVGFLEVFDLLSKDAKTPVWASFGGFRTGEPNEVGFVAAIKFRLVVAVRILAFDRLDTLALVEFLACPPSS